MAVKANTEPEVMQSENMATTSIHEADKRRKKLIAIYQKQPKVPMYLSPMYRPYVGNVMQVMINGISIFFKVDGSTQMVPETFADEITGRRMKLDAMLVKQKKLANVNQNYETAPGALKLF